MSQQNASAAHLCRGPQLFVDDFLIEKQSGLHRVLHHPDKHPANPLIVPEQPFEKRYKYHFGWGVGSVIHDAANRCFRAYWPQAMKNVLYAESDDGLHWRKPALERHAYEGRTDNNILLADHFANSVAFVPDDPEGYNWRMFALGRGKGPQLLRSRNGLDWEGRRIAVDMRGSDDACLVYDRFQDRFLLVGKFRTPIGKTIVNPLTAEPWEIPIRHLRVTHADRDLSALAPWEGTFLPDETDHASVAGRYPAIFVEGFLTPWRMKPEFEAAHALADKSGYLDRLTVAPQSGYHHMDFMNMVILPYDGLYIGLLQVLNATAHVFDFGAKGSPRADGGPGSDGTMEIQLVCSRDLAHWVRLGDRLPFLPLGEVGTWDQSMVTPFTSNHIVRDGKIWLYYGGLEHSHQHYSRWNKPGDYPGENGGIGLATLREDGFISLDASLDGGELLTRPLQFRGERLTVNAQATGGEITVELLDEQGRVLPGFERTQCVPLRESGIRQPVRWKGAPSRLDLSSQPIRIRFNLSNASLYAFNTGNDDD